MRQFETVEEAYDVCTSEGYIIPSSTVDFDRIEANLHIAEEDLQTAQDAIVKKRWNSAYIMKDTNN